MGRLPFSMIARLVVMSRRLRRHGQRETREENGEQGEKGRRRGQSRALKRPAGPSSDGESLPRRNGLRAA